MMLTAQECMDCPNSATKRSAEHEHIQEVIAAELGRSCSKRPVASPRSNASWKKTSRLRCARVRRTRSTIASGCSGGSLHPIPSDLAYPGDCTAALTEMARRSWSCHAASKDRCLLNAVCSTFYLGSDEKRDAKEVLYG